MHLRKQEHESDSCKNQDNDFNEIHISKENFNLSINTFGCSPLKLVAHKDRVSYAKRKINKIHTATKKKIATVLDVSPDLINDEPKTKELCCKSKQDLDSLMELIKAKFDISSKPEKLKLLTLVPESWNIKYTENYFSASQRMIKTARHLKQMHGIMAEPSKKEGRSISEKVKNLVHEFYQSDEYSRMCPGKKQYVSIQVDGKRQHFQKRLLLLNIKELYLEFVKISLDVKIGFSKFCELRPKWCIPVGGASGLHSVCVCEYHQNAKLLALKIPDISDYKNLLTLVVCDLTNRDCMLHSCDNCPDNDTLKEYLTTLFDKHSIEEITFNQWQKANKKHDIVPITLPVDDFIEKACQQIDQLRDHHYIAKNQAAYLQHLKITLASNHILILLDFAENYSFLIQDAVQGFHWNNSQATLHPFVIYFMEENKIKCKSICIISDNLQHNTNSVHCFIHEVLKHLKNLIPYFNHCIYFSDGASSQYKNYKNISNLCHHKQDHDVSAEWHFFATSHGKSACDGVGGTVKRLVARASLQSLVDPINSSEKMYDWCRQNIDGIHFQHISNDAVTLHCMKFKLEERYATCSTIPGTRNHHCFIPQSLTTLQMRRVSFDNVFTNVNISTMQQNYTIPLASLSPGIYIACVYDEKWFLGNIVEISEENQDILIKFMKQSISSNTFTWPHREDICWVPIMHVLCKISSLKVQSATGRCYELSAQEKTEIIHLYNRMFNNEII